MPDWFDRNSPVFQAIETMARMGRGNIDLTRQPRVLNPDGSISTVRSISVNFDGEEVLIPTVVNGRVVSDEEAIAEYQRTGRHLGKFPTPQRATDYASQLHDAYASGQYDRGKPTLSVNGSLIDLAPSHAPTQRTPAAMAIEQLLKRRR